MITAGGLLGGHAYYLRWGVIQISLTNFLIILAMVVIFGLFMTILDSTIVNIAIPRLQNVFGADLASVQWVLTAYTLAQGVATPLTAFLAQRLGQKRLYLIALASFTIGSALCGLSLNLPMLIFFRVVQGATGAFMSPLAITLLWNEFPSGSVAVSVIKLVPNPLVAGVRVRVWLVPLPLKIRLELGSRVRLEEVPLKIRLWIGVSKSVRTKLTDKLVSPEAVAVAVRAYVEETNRQNHERRAQAETSRRALEKIDRGIKGILEAIEDSMYQPAMKARMSELEQQKAEIEKRLAEAPADLPDVHPNIAEHYRAKVIRLAETLAEPESNGEACEDIRSLVGEVVITPGEKRGENHATLRGDLVAVLDLAAGRRRSPRPEVITNALAGPRNQRKFVGRILQSQEGQPRNNPDYARNEWR